MNKYTAIAAFSVYDIRNICVAAPNTVYKLGYAPEAGERADDVTFDRSTANNGRLATFVYDHVDAKALSARDLSNDGLYRR